MGFTNISVMDGKDVANHEIISYQTIALDIIYLSPSISSALLAIFKRHMQWDQLLTMPTQSGPVSMCLLEMKKEIEDQGYNEFRRYRVGSCS